MSQSSKVIVASLQKQLLDEQDARKKLEQELNNLQTVSSNIQKRLGGSGTKWAQKTKKESLGMEER